MAAEKRGGWRDLHKRMNRALQATALALALAASTAFADTIDELRTAAERGDVDAQLYLARAYYHGEEIPRNYAEGNRWLTLAAKQGVFEAQLVLAFAHLTENYLRLDSLDEIDAGFVPRSIASADLVAAYAWLIVAAAQPVEAIVQSGIYFDEPPPFGHADAIEVRDALEAVMTVEQIAEGQRMARTLWEPAGRTNSVRAAPSLPGSPIPALLPKTAVGPGPKRGYFTYDDGSTYEGEFKDGRVHGYGTYTWADGTTYAGVFDAGLPHGEGRLTWPSGGAYEGSFQAGEMSGTGMMTWPTGNTYEGEFTADRIHGYGTLTWWDGMVYSGDFVYDAIHGAGVLTWPDGTVYEGDFVRGRILGSGTMKWTSGDTYEGSLMYGDPHGEGVYTWRSGSRYVGSYHYGLAVGGLFYTTDDDGRERLYYASQNADGSWIVEHPHRQLDYPRQ